MTTEAVKRKLTAILSADAKGYSRLIRDDEVDTIRTLTAYSGTITNLVEHYRGAVVDTPSDNILA
jgi:adenylate cyclase